MELLVKLLADGLLLVLLAGGGLALFVFTSLKTKLAAYPYVIMAGLTSLLVGKLMSLVYQPSAVRPFVEQGVMPGAAYINNPGFPSDHVLLATIAALTVIVLVKKRWLSIVMVVVVVAIGTGRVLALVHTPLDVVGGLVAGLSGGVWYYLLTKNN
jgi:membrane-associated phospholipid phosphatase